MAHWLPWALAATPFVYIGVLTLRNDLRKARQLDARITRPPAAPLTGDTPGDGPVRADRPPAPAPGHLTSEVREDIRTWYCGCIVTWNGHGKVTSQKHCDAHSYLRWLETTTDWEVAP